MTAKIKKEKAFTHFNMIYLSKSIRANVFTCYNEGKSIQVIAKECGTDNDHVFDILRDFKKAERSEQLQKQLTEPTYRVETVGSFMLTKRNPIAPFILNTQSEELKSLAKKLNLY